MNLFTSIFLPTHPAALANYPAGKLVLKVLQRHLLDLQCHSCAHASQLHRRLCQAEHHRDLLPARLIAYVLIDDLLELAVAGVPHQLGYDRASVGHLSQVREVSSDKPTIHNSLYFTTTWLSNNIVSHKCTVITDALIWIRSWVQGFN